MQQATMLRIGLLLFLFFMVAIIVYVKERKPTKQGLESFATQDDDASTNEEDETEEVEPGASLLMPVQESPDTPVVSVESEEDTLLIQESEISNQNRSLIQSLYRTYLEREPTTEDMVKAYQVLSSNNFDSSPVIQMIQSSYEYKRLQAMKNMGKDLTTTKQKVATQKPVTRETFENWNAHKKQLNTYETITETFSRVLQRYPSEEELDHFYAVLTSDPSFKDRFDMNLQATAEYVRLQKMQSNLVQSELPGNITDAQVMFQIAEIYKTVFDEQEPPKEMHGYLKSKYVGYDLNDQKFKRFLQMLKQIDSHHMLPSSLPTATATATAPASATATATATAPASATASATAPPAIVTANAGLKPLGVDSGPLPPANVLQSNYMYSLLQPSQQEMQKVLNAQGLPTTGMPYLRDATAPVVSACEQELQSQQPQRLADLVQKRNMEQLGNVCTRNSYYMHVDSKLGYYGPGTRNDENDPRGKDVLPDEAACSKENGIPCPRIDNTVLIGTPLTAASHTSVGSILPGFIYKEYNSSYDKVEESA